MPQVTHTQPIEAPLDEVWAFTSDMNRWAPFLDGYQQHEELSRTHSRWKIRGEVGSLSRVMELEALITEWDESAHRIAFSLTGLNEPFTGSGTFLARTVRDGAAGAAATELSFRLEIRAGGAMGPMIDVMVEPVLEVMAGGLAQRIAVAVEKDRAGGAGGAGSTATSPRPANVRFVLKALLAGLFGRGSRIGRLLAHLQRRSA